MGFPFPAGLSPTRKHSAGCRGFPVGSADRTLLRYILSDDGTSPCLTIGVLLLICIICLPLFQAGVAENASRWAHLRSLSIAGVISGFHTWTASIPMKRTLLLDLLSDCRPPIQRNAGDPNPGRMWTITDIIRAYGEAEGEIAKTRVCTLMGNTFSADPDDPGTLAQAWYATNRRNMERAFEPVCASCPTLREFEWYASGCEKRWTVVRWKFVANPVGNSDSLHWSNYLTWEGGTNRLRVPSLQILVGTELAEYDRQFYFAAETVRRRENNMV